MLKTHKRIEKNLLTIDGNLAFSRYVLRPSDAESKERLLQIEGLNTVVPLDCALRIDKLPFKITASMMLEIAFYAVVLDSYRAAEEIVGRVHGVSVSDDTIRAVVNYVGKMIYEEDCRIAEEVERRLEDGILDFRKDKNGVLYLEADGAALNTRARDENGSTWRENKLGLAFSSDDIYHWKNHKGEECHKIERREYISYIGSVTEFKKHFFALAIRNGYGRYDKTVILSDGATWIRNVKEELFPDAQQILDFFHLCENAHSFAKAIFGSSGEACESWAKRVCDKLEDGKYQEVLGELKKYESKKMPPGTVNLYQYISNNRHNIDYPTYKANGYFIGSGAIESGNKIVLQSRLKQAGMRWNPTTAQYVLSLKAKEKSNLWNSYIVPYIMNKLG